MYFAHAFCLKRDTKQSEEKTQASHCCY